LTGIADDPLIVDGAHPMTANRMAQTRVKSVLATLLALSAALATQALAGPPPNITPNETALLPSYCKDTQTWPGGGSQEGMVRGKARFGEMFWHFHHYCYAQVYLMRADRSTTSAMERRGNLASAIDDIEYVVKYLPPDYFLLPEMYTAEGKVLRRQEKFNDAIAVLRKAIDLDATYWRAYFELAQAYEAAEDRNSALRVVKEGLQHNPESKALALYLQDLEKETKSGLSPGRVASDQSKKRVPTP